MTRRALVTGSAGFIGRHMIEALRCRGWEVNGYWDLAYEHNAMELFTSPLYSGPAADRYDLIVHAAYHVGGRAGIDGLNTNLARNAALDGALFDWAVRTRQHRVLYFSSSAAYPVALQGDKNSVELTENDICLNVPALPDAVYGWAKLSGERMAAMARGCGLPVTVVRPFSGYSGNQSEEYPFPAIIDRAISGNHYVWGPPGQTRDWIHVHDVIAGALAIAESGTEDPVNLCTGKPITMGGLLREAVRQLHLMHPSEYPHAEEIDVKHLLDAPTGVFYRVGDPNRMLSYYTPKITLEQGVQGALVRRGALRAFPR